MGTRRRVHTRAAAVATACAMAGAAAACQAPYLLSQSGSSSWSDPGLFVVPRGSSITVDYRVSGTCSFAFSVSRDVPGAGAVPGSEMDGPDLTLSGETRAGSWQAQVEPGSYTMMVLDGSATGNVGCDWSITVH